MSGKLIVENYKWKTRSGKLIVETRSGKLIVES